LSSVSETSNPDVNNTSTSDKNTSSFNGEATQFSWWKSKMYSHIIGVDDELWDIIEDGIIFKVMKKA